MPPATRTAFSDAEKAFTIEDRKFLDWKEARNDLEAYAYEFRNNLGEYGPWEKHALPEVRAPFLAELNQTVDWLYAEGENAVLADYQTRLGKFKNIGDPIKKRYNFYSLIEESFP